MLENFWRFIKDAGGWGVASNTASLVFYITGLVAASKYSAIITAYVLLTTSIPLFWIGSYLAWKNKDRELVEATERYDEGRPLLALQVLRQASWSPKVSM